LNLSVIAVGKKMPDWINHGVEEYKKRFSAGYSFSIKEVNAVKRGQSKTVSQIKIAEATNISKAVPAHSQIIALDEKGTQKNTREFAEMIRHYNEEGQDLCFIIGGADGLDASLINESREVLALSRMTLPHSIARLVLSEQLYRAVSILNNHPYHRD
jgi:23S rRNA (pseudouridine1915-N3)-methyltransferase